MALWSPKAVSSFPQSSTYGSLVRLARILHPTKPRHTEWTVATISG